VHRAADLGREHEVAARPAIKRSAEAVLALRQAVPGCGVVVADAGVPGGFQCGGGLRFGDDFEQIAEAGAAATELRDLDLSQAKAAAGERVHAFALLWRGMAPVSLAARRSRSGWCALSVILESRSCHPSLRSRGLRLYSVSMPHCQL